MKKIITRDLKNIKRYLTGGEKIITISFGIIISGFLFSNSVSATTMDTNVNIRPSMTLSVSSNDVTLNLNPATKPFDTKDLTITIGTNNPTGYKLYLNSDSTNLINTEDSSKTIETLPSSTPATGYDEASFPANYWGYRKSNGSSSSGNYLPFASDLLVSSATGPSNETTTSIGLASKIDYLKESGTYSLDFKLNAIPTITQYYMQDLSDPTLASSVCVAEHPTIVFDSRDEQAYMIQRLPDNRCWMLDNLNLDLTSRSVVANMKGIDEVGANTNATAQALNYLKNGGGTTSDQWAISGLTYENWTSGSSFSAPLSNSGGVCDSSVDTNIPCLPQYEGVSYTPNTVIAINNIGYGSYKIGMYYNYCAASVGSYCWGEGDSNTGSPSGNAISDICPSGWRLPTGGADGEYQNLADVIQINNPTDYQDSSSLNSFQTKLSTPRSGNFTRTAASSQGQYGGFWTSTYNGPTSMKKLHSGSIIAPNNSHGRLIGLSVRCILN